MNVNCAKCDTPVEIADFVIDAELPALRGFTSMIVCDRCDAENKRVAVVERRQAVKLAAMDRILETGFTKFMIDWDASKGNNEVYQAVYNRREGSLFVCGDSGTCKTRSISVWGADYVARHPKAFVMFVKYEALADKVRELAANPKGALTKYLHALSHCDLLIIDEFCSKNNETDFVVSKLEYIIDQRYQNAFKRTWITSNYPVNICSQRFGIDRGEKIMRRVVEMCGQPIVARLEK